MKLARATADEQKRASSRSVKIERRSAFDFGAAARPPSSSESGCYRQRSTRLPRCARLVGQIRSPLVQLSGIPFRVIASKAGHPFAHVAVRAIACTQPAACAACQRCGRYGLRCTKIPLIIWAVHTALRLPRGNFKKRFTLRDRQERIEAVREARRLARGKRVTS